MVVQTLAEEAAQGQAPKIQTTTKRTNFWRCLVASEAAVPSQVEVVALRSPAAACRIHYYCPNAQGVGPCQGVVGACSNLH